MKYDNSCLSLGMGRIGGAGTTDEIDCFIPQQTPGKVRREMGFNPGMFGVGNCQSLSLSKVNETGDRTICFLLVR